MIFTKERPNLLCGLLEYWSETQAKVIVLDASENTATKMLSRFYGVNYFWGESFSERAHKLRNFLDTEFACINMDDDIVLSSGAEKAIDLMNSETDMVAVASVRDFNERHVNKRNAIGRDRVLHIEESPMERIENWKLLDMRTEYPWYAIWRTAPLVTSFESAVPLGVSDSYSSKFATVGFRLSAAAMGKIKIADFDIYLKRKHYVTSIEGTKVISEKTPDVAVKIGRKERSQAEIGTWCENAALRISNHLNLENKGLVNALEISWNHYQDWERERDNFETVNLLFKNLLRRLIEKTYIITRQIDSKSKKTSLIEAILKRPARLLINLMFLFYNAVTGKRIPWNSKLITLNKDLALFRRSGMLPIVPKKAFLRVWNYQNLSPVERPISAPKYIDSQKHLL